MLRYDQVEALLQEAMDQEVHSPAEMLLTHDEIEGALPVTFHAVRELCRGYLAWLEVQPLLKQVSEISLRDSNGGRDNAIASIHDAADVVQHVRAFLSAATPDKVT